MDIEDCGLIAVNPQLNQSVGYLYLQYVIKTLMDSIHFLKRDSERNSRLGYSEDKLIWLFDCR